MSAKAQTLKLYIQPGAKESAIVGMHGDALKIRLMAPPVDGKANAALIEFLAKKLHLPKSKITIVSGHSARQKRVVINEAPENLLAYLTITEEEK